ncbi:hypothetical protein [Streptomyces laurentii]|uniref:hypothetical protein n=1 Tax=Streptomyces laurentii TaxID=39478 RepID=UPI0036C5F538
MPLTVTALVAGAMGVAGTLLFQSIVAPDTSAVDHQAVRIADELRWDLSVARTSGGRFHGGPFTQGTIVAQVRAHGGVLLRARAEPGKGGGSVNVAEVMLGLIPPREDTVAADAYPVRCYRYTFTRGPYSVKRSDLTCPAARTDGAPGSLVAQMGVLLTQQLAGTAAYQPMTTTGYAHTPEGALEFLKDKRLITAADTVLPSPGKTGSTGVYALALRINATCHYLRMDSSSLASTLVPLWPAPANDQKTCTSDEALTAAALYGIDPSMAG